MRNLLTIAGLCLMVSASNAQQLKSFREDDDKWGFKDSSGQVVVKARYKFTYDFKEGMGRVRRKDKYGFVDASGKEVVPVKYQNAYDFNEGLALVKRDDKYGFIDKTGKEVIPFQYTDAEGRGFNEGLAAVQLNGKYGFIDKTGKEIIPFQYLDADQFSEGLAPVKVDERYGYIDKTGKEVIPVLYKDADPFSEGLAAVKLYGKWGYIDRTGKEVIDYKFEYAGSFSNGTAGVKLDDKYIYIGKDGKNDEMRKKDAALKAEEEKEKKQLAEALEKKDEMAAQVYKLYLDHDGSLFKQVNALNEYLKASMKTNDKGELTTSPMWGSMSIQMKDEYCKNASAELERYKSAVKGITLTQGKNELYDKINNYLVNVEQYISSCRAWAEFMSDRTNAFDRDAVIKQMDYMDKPLQAMGRGERTMRAFVSIYKKRNGL